MSKRGLSHRHQCKAPRDSRGFAGWNTLGFVASPQRVPAVGGRLRASDVVSVSYKIPPARDCLRHRRDLAVFELGGAPGCGTRTREHRYSRLTPYPRAPIGKRATYDPRLRRAGAGFKPCAQVFDPATFQFMTRQPSHRLRRSPTARHARRCDGERDARRHPHRDPACRPPRVPCRSRASTMRAASRRCWRARA